MKTKKKIIIAGSIVAASIVVAIGINQFVYKGKPWDYVQTEKQLKKSEQKKKDQFNELKSDNFPTIQEAVKYLQQTTGKKNLTEVNIHKIKNILDKKYGKDKSNIIWASWVLNENMTPEQIKEQEIFLAQKDEKRTDFVGTSSKLYTTDLYNLNDISTKSNFFAGLYMFPQLTFDKEKLHWTKDNSYEISSPTFFSFSPSVVENITNEKELSKNKDKLEKGVGTIVVFVKIPDKEISTDKFRKYISTLDVKFNGVKLDLAKSKDDKSMDGLQLTSFEDLSGKTKFKDADEIFPNSIIPVCFDVIADKISDGEKISVKINDFGPFELNENSTGENITF